MSNDFAALADELDGFAEGSTSARATLMRDAAAAIRSLMPDRSERAHRDRFMFVRGWTAARTRPDIAAATHSPNFPAPSDDASNKVGGIYGTGISHGSWRTADSEEAYIPLPPGHKRLRNLWPVGGVKLTESEVEELRRRLPPLRRTVPGWAIEPDAAERKHARFLLAEIDALARQIVWPTATDPDWVAYKRVATDEPESSTGWKYHAAMNEASRLLRERRKNGGEGE